MTIEPVVCPLCGSWYKSHPEYGLFWEAGDVCGNMAMTGPNPAECSPDHPCPGVLVPAEGDDGEED